MALLVSEVPANAAGVFTTNAIQAAPLIVTKEAMQTGKMQAIIVNSGMRMRTGQQGLVDARLMQQKRQKTGYCTC